jgi:hypothetical membrane protein
VGQNIFGQNSLPTIKATSEIVDVRVGTDYFSKGGWHLQPEIKPDIFSIGSKWIYDRKKVTFITNLDSISFDVQPGQKYDFIILLNEKSPCHIQITTLPNPVFMNKNVIIPIILGLIFFAVFVYLKRNVIKLSQLLYLGILTPVIFWIMTFISGYIHGDYVHYKNVISELGAIGTKSEIFTSSTFIVLSVLCALFSIGLIKASKQFGLSIIPAILTVSMPITLFWVAVFPLGNEFHSLTGLLILFMLFSALFASILWRNKTKGSNIRLLSLISFFIMLFILLRFLKPFGYEYEGLVQRFFYLGWSFWYISLSLFFIKQLKTENTTP